MIVLTKFLLLRYTRHDDDVILRAIQWAFPSSFLERSKTRNFQKYSWKMPFIASRAPFA